MDLNLLYFDGDGEGEDSLSFLIISLELSNPEKVSSAISFLTFVLKKPKIFFIKLLPYLFTGESKPREVFLVGILT